MKKILAHSERDAQNRRASFEERFRYYSGHLRNLEQIKLKVNAELEVKYLKGYFGKAPNPIYGFINGKFSFSEQGLRKVLKKNGADLTLFKINVSPETARELLNLNTSENIRQMPSRAVIKPTTGFSTKRTAKKRWAFCRVFAPNIS